MRRWEPFPEEKGRCVKGGVVGPSGVSAAPPQRGQDAAAPLQALPCPHPSLNRSARCGRCSCLLRGPGPQGKTRCSFSPCLGVLTGPWGGGVLSRTRGRKASLEQVGGGSSPPSPVCAQLQEVTKPVRPPHRPLLSLGLLPRGADVAGPPAAFGLTCLGDAGSRARGTWEFTEAGPGTGWGSERLSLNERWLVSHAESGGAGSRSPGDTLEAGRVPSLAPQLCVGEHHPLGPQSALGGPEHVESGDAASG